MGSTFTDLNTIPNVMIDRCQQVLPNKMQCWRPGAFLVSPAGQGAQASGTKQEQTQQGSGNKPASKGATSGQKDAEQSANATKSQSSGTTSSQAESTGQAEGTGASAVSLEGPVSYQLCRIHKTILEAAEKQAASSGKSVEEVQAQMLGADDPYYTVNKMPTSVEEREKERLRKEELEYYKQPARS